MQHSVDPDASIQSGLTDGFTALDSRICRYILCEFPAGILRCQYRVRITHQTGLATWIGWLRSRSDGPRRALHVYTVFLRRKPTYHSTIQTKIHLPSWFLVFGIGLVRGYGITTHACGWFIQPCLPNIGMDLLSSSGWFIQPCLPNIGMDPVPFRARCGPDGSWHQSAAPRCDTCTRSLDELSSHLGIPVPES